MYVHRSTLFNKYNFQRGKKRGVILLDFKANYKVTIIKTHIISIKAYIHTHTHTHINVYVNLYMEQNKEAKNRSTYVWKLIFNKAV